MDKSNTTSLAILKKYLEAKTILIADGSSCARSGIFQIFKSLGAKSQQLHLVSTFAQAEQDMIQVKPHVVVAEYDLGRRCGLDLLQNQRLQRPEETKNCIFVLVTGNTSQQAVARAVEEDIDAYILKPLFPEEVASTILRAAVMKIQPPPYLQTVEQGKQLISSGRLDEAEAKLKEALPLEQTPTLALFYLGQCAHLKNLLPEARKHYLQGLKYNELHYKCLVGFYELCVSEQDHETAYEIVRKIANFFPASPKRLTEVLRLAIVTRKFADIDEYYKLFTSIDNRNEAVIRHVCAALVICGKHFLSCNEVEKARLMFEKAAISSAGRSVFLKEIIGALTDFGHAAPAAKFLARFAPDSYNSDEFLYSQFLVASLSRNSTKAVDYGRVLLAKCLGDERVYRILIRCYLEAKILRAAEDLLEEAKRLFPKKAQVFEQVFQKSKLAA
jgi:DNA-binding NarL/FixJ family response regulator